MDIFNPFPKLGNYDHPCKEVIRRGQGTYPLLLAIVLQDGPISLPLSISLLHEVFELKATLQMNPIVCNKGAPSRMGDTHVIIALEWCDYVVARHHASLNNQHAATVMTSSGMHDVIRHPVTAGLTDVLKGPLCHSLGESIHKAALEIALELSRTAAREVAAHSTPSQSGVTVADMEAAFERAFRRDREAAAADKLHAEPDEDNAQATGSRKLWGTQKKTSPQSSLSSGTPTKTHTTPKRHSTMPHLPLPLVEGGDEVTGSLLRGVSSLDLVVENSKTGDSSGEVK